MDNYKKIIDSLIDELNKEYESKHEKTTKALNYEYITGKMFGLFDIVQETLGFDYYFKELHDYRRAERDELCKKFNENVIHPIYKIVRAS